MGKTDAQLQAQADIIMNETTQRANTAARVGQMLKDIISNKPNTQTVPVKYNSNTLLSNEDVVEADCTLNNLNFTVPDATTNSGKEFTVIKVDSSSHSFSLITVGGQTISGSSTKTVDTQWAGYKVKSNGTNYTVTSNI